MAPYNRSVFLNREESRLTRTLKPLRRTKLLYDKVVTNFRSLNLKGFVQQVGRILVDDFCEIICSLLGRDDENRINMTEFQQEIYGKLMKNPKLHAVNESVDINSFIYKGDDEGKTARHYASFLWNWKLHYEAKKFDRVLESIQRSIYLTLKYMNERDLQIVQTMILYNHPNVFKCTDCILSPSYARIYLQDQIYHNHKATETLVEILQNWFLITPIIMELSKCTGWEYLHETKACLLDLDTLYSIFLNILYKTPQAAQPPTTQI